jgi:putative endonuclease
MSSDRRRATGHLGEELAARHLERSGYRILDRNFRTRFGELDLVAEGDRCLVFCEVKTRVGGSRRGPDGPLDAVGERKRRQVRRMAGEWLRQRREGRSWTPGLRYDVIGVTIDAAGAVLTLEHVEDAF